MRNNPSWFCYKTSRLRSISDFMKHLAEYSSHSLHVLHDTVVKHPCVMLGHTCGRMSQHFRHVLDGHVVGERHRGREGVPAHMDGQAFLYIAQGSYFLQIFVHLLIRRNGQTRRVRILFIPPLVFLQNSDGRR